MNRKKRPAMVRLPATRVPADVAQQLEHLSYLRFAALGSSSLAAIQRELLVQGVARECAQANRADARAEA